MQRVTAALPAGAAHLAVLGDGSVAVLGKGAVRELDTAGRTVAAQAVSGGEDIAADPTTGGLIVLHGAKALKLSRELRPGSARSVHLPPGPATGAAISVAGDGSVRVATAARPVFAGPGGGALSLENGRLTVRDDDGRREPDRTITGSPARAQLIGIAGDVLTHAPPPGATEASILDAPAAPGD